MIDDERFIPITDDHMFAFVMRSESICARVIECMLPGIRVAKVRYKDELETASDTQKTIQGNIGMRDVRLDVYLDDGKTVFNVEMQTGNKRNLPKRARYYGSKIDCDQLEKGQDYSKLKPTYIIFICTFDPFGRDLYRYTFENTCAEADGMRLNDETYKVFFNTLGHKGEISDELKRLLEYFNSSVNTDENDELLNEIDSRVKLANHDADWRRGHMTMEQAIMDATIVAREQGREEGREEGKFETVIEFVKSGLLSISDACKKMGISEDEFYKLMTKYNL